MNKLKRLIIFTLVLLLSTGISYALFSDSITVSGTATTTGTFAINTTAAVVTTQVGSSSSTAVISGDKKTVTLTVPKLEYPGAYTTFTITLKNEGNIPAKVINIVPTSLGDDDVVASYSGIALNSTIAPNATLSFTFKVMWDSGSTTANTTGATIDVDFVFQQNV